MSFRTESLRLVNLSSDMSAAGRFSSALKDIGQLTVLTHPFFQEDNTKQQARPGIEAYRQERNHLLKDWRNENSVLLVLEGIDMLDKLTSRLERLGLQGDVYVFMTHPTEPAPLIPECFQSPQVLNLLQLKRPRELPSNWKTRCWDKLASLLSQVQLSSVRLGGEYLFFFDEEDCTESGIGPIIKNYFMKLAQPQSGILYDRKGKELNLLPRYCVGVTATELLLRGFNISLSAPSWPNQMCRDESIYLGT